MVHQTKGPVSQELDLSCQPDSHLRTWDQSGTGSVLSAGQSPQDMGSVSQSGTGSVLSTSHLRTWGQQVSQELDLSCQLDSHLRTWDQSVSLELDLSCQPDSPASYTHLRAHETA